MNDIQLESFINQLDAIEVKRQRIASAILQHLNNTDPELVKLAVMTIEDTEIAALWLSDTVSALGDRRPIDLLAMG